MKAAATWEHVSTIRPDPDNPVIHTPEEVEELRALIADTVWTDPIVCRRADRQIIAGHRRLSAALLAIGEDPAWQLSDAPKPGTVPVRFVDVTPEQARRLLLADNAMTKQSAWDEEVLGRLLREMDAAEVVGIGFDEDELRRLIDAGDAPPKPPASDDAPEVQQGPADSQPGQVYELGPHRLVCGDCRDPEVVRLLLAGRRVNLAFTSPPYASQRTYDESSGFKPIPPDEYVAWFEAVQANVREHLAPDGSWFVNIKAHSEDGQRHLYVMDLAIAHVRAWGWGLVDEFCWLRQSLPGDPNSMRKFKNGFEPVFHFAGSNSFKFRPDDVRHESDHAFAYKDQKKAGRYISSSSQGKGSNAQSPVGQGEGMAYPSNVIEVKQGANVVGHSAAFPVAFPLFFVQAFTDPDDVVYDPFMGSGTTLMAAAQNGRVGFGCEISPTYCDLIRRRWTRYARERGIDPGTGALDG